jgi:hypothetical protein
MERDLAAYSKKAYEEYIPLVFATRRLSRRVWNLATN